MKWNHFILAAVIALSILPDRLRAQGSPRLFVPHLLGAQITAFGQHLAPFSASYSGTNSLTDAGDIQATHTYGLYLGSFLPAGFQVYADLEMARGAGIGHAVGLAGITNGDVLRQGSVELGKGPYVARAFVQYLLPLNQDRTVAERGMDQLPGREASARLEIKAGKLAATDDFDQNRYANNTRTQFGNWGLVNNSAWDYAADTRGYSYGTVLAWVHPDWTLRVGSYFMPTFANGNVFDTDLLHARGDNAELTVKSSRLGSVIRVLAYQNHGRMGDYAEAIAQARNAGTIPDIVADDRPGRRKYGFAVNVEKPVADSGETGAFLRAGWNDGATESFVFTEVDRHLSAGLQVSGRYWQRGEDRLGMGYLLHGLSANHRAYLAAGGLGFLLGDGRLTYGAERILESYYRAQVGHLLTFGPDLQWIVHPAYNRDRGPATVIGFRARLSY